MWLICNKTWHFKSPACATSDDKLPLPYAHSAKLVDSAASDDGAFCNLASPPLDIILIWPSDTFLHLCPLLVRPVRSSSAGGHICIRLFAETSPWRPCHVWRPPVISSVHCVKWAMTSSTLSFYLRHSIPHCSACFPVLHYCVCVCLYDAGG